MDVWQAQVAAAPAPLPPRPVLPQVQPAEVRPAEVPPEVPVAEVEVPDVPPEVEEGKGERWRERTEAVSLQDAQIVAQAPAKSSRWTEL